MMSTVEPINLWPSLIYKSTYPGDLTDIADKFLTYFDENATHNLEKNGGMSTYGTANNLISDPICNNLKEWLIQQSKAAWNLSNFVDRPRRVHRSWVNLHPPGAWTDEHDHSMCHQNIVIYLKQPKLGGNIMFKDPLQYTFSGFPKNNKNDWTVLEVNQNDVIFFPGFLHHKTEINASEENRLVMTLTIAVDVFADE